MPAEAHNLVSYWTDLASVQTCQSPKTTFGSTEGINGFPEKPSLISAFASRHLGSCREQTHLFDPSVLDDALARSGSLAETPNLSRARVAR